MGTGYLALGTSLVILVSRAVFLVGCSVNLANWPALAQVENSGVTGRREKAEGARVERSHTMGEEKSVEEGRVLKKLVEGVVEEWIGWSR